MTNPTPHGQAPDTLIALIDAYAETHHRCGRIHNAKTEAARNAVIEALSGVQALSAAPAGWKLVPVEPTDEMLKAADDEDDAYTLRGFGPGVQRVMQGPYDHYCAMLAASPTPPAEQQATKETSGGVTGWRDISTAPKDRSRFVATGHNYGLYSEDRHACVAQWFRGCWMEASDWNETSELKYLTHWMPLPSPPDDVAAPSEQQATTSESGAVDRTGCTAGTDEECTRRGCATSCPAAPRAAPVEQDDHQILAITTAYEQGVGKGHQAYNSGKEIANPYSPAYRCDLAWRYGYKEGKEQAQREAKAAPGVGNSGFDHQTAADFLSGKTVSDEAVRKFVQASRWAHDERSALSATLLAMQGVLTSREAEIALLKKALMEAEAAPAPNLAKALNQKTLQNDSLHTRSEHDKT